MADEKELQLDADELDSSGGGNKKLIIIIVAVVLLVGIGVGVALFLMGGDEADPAVEEAGAAIEEPMAASKGPATYIKFKPQFIINYQVANRQRYLQIHMEALTRDARVAAAMDTHSPMIRSAIINLLSTQDFKVLRTAEGRTSIRENLTVEVNRLITQETGIDSGVEQILFTNFVIQ
ncbi:MAG: flagellar basal body-associated FliL family protein [Bermanella sp.]